MKWALHACKDASERVSGVARWITGAGQEGFVGMFLVSGHRYGGLSSLEVGNRG